MRTPRLRARTLAAPAFALLLAACGGESETATAASSSSGGDAASSAGQSIEELAEANEEILQPADDARDVEVLDVGDGSIATLREAVAGDRPVLLWFWSPH